MRERIRRVLRSPLEAIWPTRCPVCGEEAEDGAVWATDESQRPLLHRSCLQGLPRAEVMPWSRRAGFKPIPVRWCFEDCPEFFRILHAVKYEGRWALLDPLARSFVAWSREQIRGASGVVLIGVPDDPSRRRARGGSVVETLVTALARGLPAPHLRGLLVRRRSAPPQARISGRARRGQNVRTLFGAGDLSRAPAGWLLVLVDDQVTTGATVREATFRLGLRGHRVCVLALAGARQAPRWLDP